jgi:Sigma-70, region 4
VNNAPQKALVRVTGGGGRGDTGLFTQKEVAVLLRISERAVRTIERRAIEKLRRHPALRQLWREWTTGEIEEASEPRPVWELTRAELAAVCGLARTPAERELLRRLFIYAGVKPSL